MACGPLLTTTTVDFEADTRGLRQTRLENFSVSHVNPEAVIRIGFIVVVPHPPGGRLEPLGSSCARTRLAIKPLSCRATLFVELNNR